MLRIADYENNRLAMNAHKHRLLQIILITGLIIPSLGWSSCGRTNKTKVRIAYLPYSSSLAFFVANERGYFTQAGLDVEPIKLASANEALDALKAGNVDFVTGVGLSSFFAMEGSSPGSFKCFQPAVEDSTHSASYLLVPKDSNISDVSQLKGKRVGTYSGTSQVLVLRLLLRKIGLDPDNPKDVTIGDVASNLQVDALAAGQFDAFLMLEPYATRAMILHGAKPLLRNPRVDYILNPFPAGANAVSSTFLTAHPDLANSVVSSLDRAIEDIGRDEASAKSILPKYDTTLTQDLSARSGIYRWLKKSETTIQPIQQYANLLFEGKAIKNQVNVDSMFLK
jgi:NitT/TauT family transport system substrate-binding protein